MDRHLTYVAMTRHREQAALYAGCDDFENYGEMAGSLARKRTKETTLDFAERRGIDTLRDWIGNGRALLNRAQARLEQAAARIGERLGLGGRSLRQELQERRPQTAEPPQGPGSKRRLHSHSAPLTRGCRLRRGGKPPPRRNSRPCGPKPSAPWPWPKSGPRRSPKSSMRSGGPSQPSQDGFHFLAPNIAIKRSWQSGRRSGILWWRR